MPTPILKARLRAFARAWPWPGAVLLFAAFLVTFFWFLSALLEDASAYKFEWFEPLAAIVGGLGAFTIAAALIFRRIESAETEAKGYRLARGLATAYYFNFVRPAIGALRDPRNPVHSQEDGIVRIAGLIVAIPDGPSEFDAEAHKPALRGLMGPFTDDTTDPSAPAPEFRLREIRIALDKRPRPLTLVLAVHVKTGVGLLLDIPTVLVAISDFAQFIAEMQSAADSSDERITEARREIVAASEAEQFGDILREFESVMVEAGSRERRERSPTSLLHVVPLRRLRRRADELVAD